MSDQCSAFLLVAHGSRRAEANADLVRLQKMIRDRNVVPVVEIGYLELAKPSIPDGADRCVAEGATTVRILPYFLSAGRHLAEDLEGFRADFRARYPDVTWELSPPLGLHEGIVDALLARSREDFTTEKVPSPQTH